MSSCEWVQLIHTADWLPNHLTVRSFSDATDVMSRQCRRCSNIPPNCTRVSLTFDNFEKNKENSRPKLPPWPCHGRDKKERPTVLIKVTHSMTRRTLSSGSLAVFSAAFGFSSEVWRCAWGSRRWRPYFFIPTNNEDIIQVSDGAFKSTDRVIHYPLK